MACTLKYGLVGAMVWFFAREGQGQAALPPRDAKAAARASGSAVTEVAFGVTFPPLRPLGVFPEVDTTGLLSWSSSVSTLRPRPAIPATSAIALADLTQYAAQLETMFPPSGAMYPADSIRGWRAARARAWTRRLTRNGVLSPSSDASGILAQVALIGGDDTLARRLFDARLATLPTTAPERSLILATAVYGFTEMANGRGTTARRSEVALSSAAQYTDQLIALPLERLPTRSDRADAQQRRLDAARLLLDGALARGRVPDVLTQVDRWIGLVQHIRNVGDNTRFSMLHDFPYARVIAVIARGQGGAPSGGRATIDALNARLVALVALQAGDSWPGDAWQGRPIPAATRETILANFAAATQEVLAPAEHLDHPAPEIVAHAWLNTSDSAYSSVPRSHTLADGVLRVVTLGAVEDTVFSMLERVQQRFPRVGAGAVEVVLVTATMGAVGPDLATPADEISWLRHWYHDVWQVTFPVAIWAGSKTENEFHEFQPAPSPNDTTYQFLESVCAIVDGHGIVRSYHPLVTREDEAELVRQLRALGGMPLTTPSRETIDSATHDISPPSGTAP